MSHDANMMLRTIHIKRIYFTEFHRIRIQVWGSKQKSVWNRNCQTESISRLSLERNAKT